MVELLRDSLEVLAFVHRQGVIHRDIKPSNLMRRSSDGKIVLIDFGAVKQISLQTGADHSNLTVAIGSSGYMPAEQLASHPQLSSDIYAMGMVSLQALTGITPTALPRDQQTGEVCCYALANQQIHSTLAQILDKMVRYDYRQRYVDANAALQAVNAITELVVSDSLNNSLTHVSTDVLPIENAIEQNTVLLPDQAETLPPMPVASPVRSYPGQSTRSPTTSREYRNRQALLNKVKQFWIHGVLETSLPDRMPILLGMEARPEAIVSPWTITVAIEQQPPQTLPPGTPIFSVFDQLGTGRTLLILGEPGAGKTTTLLQLAQELIARAETEADHLIPVVLNLSSWSNPAQSIADWVVAELNTKYQVPRKVGQIWVENQELLLLLDGLDEVQVDRRQACVVALNQFQQESSTEMVICCRIRDYEALRQRLRLQHAIYLRSLTFEQVQQYLDLLTADLTGLKTLLQRDSVLQELAGSPLMLNLMVLAYEGRSIDDLPQDQQLDWQNRLFEAYIQRRIRQRSSRTLYSEAQTFQWLTWLARQLKRASETIFLIERIDPNWMQTPKQRWAYSLIASFAVGAIFSLPIVLKSDLPYRWAIALLFWITFSLTNCSAVWVLVWKSISASTISHQNRIRKMMTSFYNGLLSGLIFGCMAGISASLNRGLLVGFIVAIAIAIMDWSIGGVLELGYIKPVEALKVSWHNVFRNVSFYLIPSIPVGFFLGQFHVFANPWQGMMLNGLGAFSIGVLTGLRSDSEVELRTMPNQGVWRSVQFCLIALAIGVAISTLAMLAVNLPLYLALFYLAMLTVLAGGGSGLVHLTLRFVLWADGRMPWNYARFLDHCCDRALLQKVGGGYIFIHRLLLEHFAQDVARGR